MKSLKRNKKIQKILIAATTLNSKIAKEASHTVDWTSQEDKSFFRREVEKAGVVIFGEKTYKIMAQILPLPKALNIIMTYTPQQYQAQEKRGSLEFTSAPPSVLLDELYQRGYKKVIIAGGSTIYSLFLRKKLVDRIYITIAPKIFGRGVPLFKEMDIDEINFKLLSLSKLTSDEVLLKYRLT